MDGYEVVHVRLVPARPYRKGFELIDQHLRELGRPPQALCGIELRSPRPLSFTGFAEFNEEYQRLLAERGLLVDGSNPVARTNVAPELDPPSEALLHAFSYTAAAAASGISFVVAGSAELSGERLDAQDIVARGDVSPDGMRQKARQVLDWMEKRLHGLGASWARCTAIDIYTVHDIWPLMPSLLLPQTGARAVDWHFARPPLDELDFEMDVRGCRRELVLQS